MKNFNFFIILFLSLTCFLNAQSEYPILTQIVTDNANVFSEEELLELKQKLTDYETLTTHQIVVLTIESLGNDTIENYAVQTFNRDGNKFGKAAEDNGILILFSNTDRKVRIEVGDGFTPIITDIFSKKIIENIMIPAFKEQNYFQGINAATTKIIKLIDSPEYRDEFANIIEKENKFPLWVMILSGFFCVLFLGVFLFFGGKFFYEGYKQLINLFMGLITGKLSILLFPFLLILTALIPLAFSLPFIIIPLIFAVVMVLDYYEKGKVKNLINVVENSEYLTINSIIIFAIILFVIIPLAIAYFTRSKKEFTPIKFSLFKSDKKYSLINKNYSSGGVSSGRSSFSSSASSSSSFSGGGGRSSGGGASGSW